MGPIKEILAETQFQEELTLSSQQKLVVVDFTASWCGPCQTIAPFYEQLSRKYPNAVFLKVDVDKCQETAVNQRVSVMPTFHFYRNKVKVDSMQGADPQKLEEKIQKYYDDGTADADVGVAGHVVAPKKSKQSKKREPKPKRESKASGKKKIWESRLSRAAELESSTLTAVSLVRKSMGLRLVESKASLKALTSPVGSSTNLKRLASHSSSYDSLATAALSHSIDQSHLVNASLSVANRPAMSSLARPVATNMSQAHISQTSKSKERLPGEKITKLGPESRVLETAGPKLVNHGHHPHHKGQVNLVVEDDQLRIEEPTPRAKEDSSKPLKTEKNHQKQAHPTEQKRHKRHKH